MSKFSIKCILSQFVSFLKKPNQRFLALLDYVIVALAIFYFAVLSFSNYEMFGLEHPIVRIPAEIKQINEIVLFAMLGLLSFEVILKYMKIRNWKKFVRKYWLDLAMIILIPIFSGIKLFKVVKLAKQTKIAKYGFKVVDKTKKWIKRTKE